MENKNEKQQLLKIISVLLDGFGKFGKYNKPKFTPSGKRTKNCIFEYPHKGELLDMFLQVKNNEYDAGIIHMNCMRLKKELLDMEDTENI